MGNPVRPWKNFLTAWEKRDEAGHSDQIRAATKMLRDLRAFRKDIDSRIAYWEANLEMSQSARRGLEWKGRSRERHERIVRPKTNTTGRRNASRFDNIKARAE